MAKKKHTPKKRTHHRRHSGRIGSVGMGHFNVMQTLETGLGLMLGSMVGTMMQKHMTRFPQKLVSAGQLILGVMNTNRPNKIIQGAAWGLASAGALGLAHEVGVLRGVDEMISGADDESMNGAEEIQYLSGMDNDMTISGMPNGTTLGATEGEGVSAPSDQFYAPVLGMS